MLDVRSGKALKVFQTNKTRVPSGSGGACGWLSDDLWEWIRGSSKAPGWSDSNVKVTKGNFDKEITAFTEHESLIHLVEARTFETDEVIRVSTVPRRLAPLLRGRSNYGPCTATATTFLHQRRQLFTHRFSTQFPCLWAVQSPEAAYYHTS